MRRYFSFFCLLVSPYLLVAQTQEVFGTVSDILGEPLIGASIAVIDGAEGTYTDLKGEFSLTLPIGDHILEFSYLGYGSVRDTVTLDLEDKEFVEIELLPRFVEAEEIVVLGRLTRGQVKALNSQRTAPNIRNIVHSELFNKYPDINLAETVQRLPGVSITRNRGEGEFVQVRGLPEDFNSLAINGQRLPSMVPESGRAVGLDIVQSNLIEEVRLIKALTPDMDGDAIGGMIDFRIKEPAKKPEIVFQGGYGYNQQESFVRNAAPNIFQGAFILSQRISENRLGLLFAGSYFDTQRGAVREFWRYSAPTGNGLNERRITDFDIHRQRYGFVVQADYKIGVKSKIRFGYNLSGYRDDQIQRQALYRYDSQEELRQTRNRLQDQSIYLFTLNGTSVFNNLQIDYHLAFADAEENLPDRTLFSFQRRNTYDGLNDADRFSLDPQTNFNLDPLTLQEVSSNIQNTNELVLNAGIDLTLSAGNANKIKFGGKIRGTDRLFGIYRNTAIPTQIGSDATLASGTFGFADVHFDDPAVAALDLSNYDFSGDLYESDIAYEAQEDVYSGYVMNTTQWSEKFTSLIGFRIEHTQNDYTQPISGSQEEGFYATFLPSAHFTLRFNDNSQLRLSYTESLSRPPFNTLIPFDNVDNVNFRIRRGNVDLQPVESNNFDVMYENYGRRLSSFTAGLFVKLLSDPIVDIATSEDREGRIYTVFQPINSGDANVVGGELSLYQNLGRFVPGLRNFSINANYTYTNSSADFGELGDNDLPLIHSPQHTSNLSLVFDDAESYFSFVLAGVYRDFMFDRFEDGNQIWLDRNFYLDFSGNYNWRNGFGVFLRLNNLTNQPDQEILGRPNDATARPYELERFGMWGTVGIRYRIMRENPDEY